jgi:hypothetical protein
MARLQKLFGGLMFLTLLGWQPPPASAQMIPGYADDVRRMDKRDLALLPPYCKYTQDFREKVEGGNDRLETERWQATLGSAFHHLHHYCYGLMKANRAVLLAREERVRRFYLNDAIAEFDYVIDRSTKDFVLLPEILARRGQMQFKLGQAVFGQQSLEMAIAIKPDYWLPYAVAGEFYATSGDRNRSRDWLTRGLSNAPNSAELKTRLAALDKPPNRSAGKL